MFDVYFYWIKAGNLIKKKIFFRNKWEQLQTMECTSGTLDAFYNSAERQTYNFVVFVQYWYFMMIFIALAVFHNPDDTDTDPFYIL